jgi:hypothetical protein
MLVCSERHTGRSEPGIEKLGLTGDYYARGNGLVFGPSTSLAALLAIHRRCNEVSSINLVESGEFEQCRVMRSRTETPRADQKVMVQTQK